MDALAGSMSDRRLVAGLMRLVIATWPPIVSRLSSEYGRGYDFLRMTMQSIILQISRDGIPPRIDFARNRNKWLQTKPKPDAKRNAMHVDEANLHEIDNKTFPRVATQVNIYSIRLFVLCIIRAPCIVVSVLFNDSYVSQRLTSFSVIFGRDSATRFDVTRLFSPVRSTQPRSGSQDTLLPGT